MQGDDPRHRETLKRGDLFAASWWRRVFIALAGPGANFVFAIILSVVLLWVGIQVPDAPNVVGTVTAGGLADSLGFRSGDEIVAVDDGTVTTLKGVYDRLPSAEELAVAGDPLRFRVSRGAVEEEILVPPARLSDLFGELVFPRPAVVGEVAIGLPAYKAGIVVGDRVVAIDDTPVINFSDLQTLVQASPGQEIVITVEREDRTVKIPITPATDTRGGEPVGMIGITASHSGSYVVRLGIWDGLREGPRSTVRLVGAVFGHIGSLFSNPSNVSQITGPVGIIQASGEAAQAGPDRLINMAILISVALMVFNLLPIPILDGGMVVLSLLEAVRRKPVGEKGLALYQGIGIAVMGTLLIFVLINDPLRILQRHNALGRAGDLTP
jgi:regulator of sigma E protease